MKLDSDWEQKRRLVLSRDKNCCTLCNVLCSGRNAHVHHLIPRASGGSDSPENLITLCSGCHASYHPNLQASLARRTIEKWGIRLAKWLDRNCDLPKIDESLGAALRLMGCSHLYPVQLEVVLAALSGKSVLLVSPTGSGKTLCFQLPTLLRPGCSFVISPLKALMSEQVVELHRKQIPSSFVNGDLSPKEKSLRFQLLQSHVLKFWYCTPERFDKRMVREEEIREIIKVQPTFFVVDEAHCIDRWGRDFRPNYSRLGAVRKALNNPPVLAFTATAGKDTQRRILESLGEPKAKVIVTGVDRPNIALSRLMVSDFEIRIRITHALLNKVQNGRVMIFVPTVKIGEKVQEGLRRFQQDIPFYHSKNGTANERDTILGRFTGRINPILDAVICTNAFGMGLDVPDVRLVIHWQYPSSVEDYLQEFGRAGRDGNPSLALLFTAPDDDNLLKFMAGLTVKQADIDPSSKKEVLIAKHRIIRQMRDLALDSKSCFRSEVIQYFRDDSSPPQKSLSLKIIEWLFMRPERRRSRKASKSRCCDKCAMVSTENILRWADFVLNDNGGKWKPKEEDGTAGCLWFFVILIIAFMAIKIFF